MLSFTLLLVGMLILSSSGLRTLRSTAAGRITRRFLNRILFEAEEVQERGGGLVALLPAEDFRAKHINTVRLCATPFLCTNKRRC
jgi:hypothetical protein